MTSAESARMEREAIAELLLEYVRKNEVQKVEELLGNGDTQSWRDVIRYEFKIQDIMETVLQYEILLPHLLSYEITTLSPFHLAAMSGHNDVIVNFIDHDVPVDVGLSSGTTALHLACLAGKVNTVGMLIDVYKAEVNRKDNYGWSAVHYAATEGHLDVIQVLVAGGADVTVRDKDGTAAAFRAEVNGHQKVVDFLMEHGDEEMLNVEDDDDDDVNKRQSYHPLYATVNKGVKKPSKPAKPPKPEVLRHMSVPGKSAGLSTVVPAPSATQAQKAATLAHPREARNTAVRRLIRRELEMVFNVENDPDYECPVDVRMAIEEAKKTGSSVGGDSKLLTSGHVGINTLKGIMREEFEKYKKEFLSPGPETGAHGFDEFKPDSETKYQDNDLYEDLYASIRVLGPAPKAPPSLTAIFTPHEMEKVPETNIVFAPPLPPRNDTMPRKDGDVQGEPLMLGRPQPTSMQLKESMHKIAPKLGENWKKLAHALPLENTPEKVEKRINAIEKSHPNDRPKQAALALAEWRINQSGEADVDHLIYALRKCNLGEIISDIETVTQEFTA